MRKDWDNTKYKDDDWVVRILFTGAKDVIDVLSWTVV